MLPNCGLRAWSCCLSIFVVINNKFYNFSVFTTHCTILKLFGLRFLLYMYPKPCLILPLKPGLCQTVALFRMSEMHVFLSCLWACWQAEKQSKGPKRLKVFCVLTDEDNTVQRNLKALTTSSLVHQEHWRVRLTMSQTCLAYWTSAQQSVWEMMWQANVVCTWVLWSRQLPMGYPVVWWREIFFCSNLAVLPVKEMLHKNNPKHCGTSKLTVEGLQTDGFWVVNKDELY